MTTSTTRRMLLCPLGQLRKSHAKKGQDPAHAEPAPGAISAPPNRGVRKRMVSDIFLVVASKSRRTWTRRSMDGGARMLSRSVAAITVGAIVGGVIGLVVGLLIGVDNPFVYMGIGIAVGAGMSIPFIVRGE